MQERHDRDGSDRGQDNKQGSMEEYHHQLYRRPQIYGTSQGRRRLEISIKFMEMFSLQIEPQTSDNPKDKLCFRLEVNTHTRAWDSRGTNNNANDDHVTSFPSAKQISSSRKVRHLLQNDGTKFNKSTQNIVRYNIKQH